VAEVDVDRKTLAAIVVTLVVAARGNAFAQDPAAVRKALDRLSPGDTISVRDSDGGRDIGPFTGLTDTKLLIDGVPSKINPARITRLTVRDSPSNGAKIGALIGGAAGAVGAIVLGSIAANEGGDAAAGAVLLVAAGIGTGAGVGWLGDSLTQRQLYRAEGTAREFSPELRVRAGATRRSGVQPAFGVSWSRTGESGLGFEVNADRTGGSRDGAGRGFSIDGRVLYAFGRGRVRPYLSGGLGYGEHHENLTFEVPPSVVVPNGVSYSGQYRIEGFAPVLGGGLRVQPARHLVIRPEVTWSLEPTGTSRTRKPLPRAGVSIGAAW
jgi:hypothetical protein